MEKILYIAPHLSTGGLPQYLTKKIELLKDDYQIYVVEYEDITGGVLVVQKNKLIELIRENLITLPWGSNKNAVISYIKKIKPNIIHFEEMPEYFMSDEIAKQIYTPNRDYKIFETSHDSSFKTENKRFIPDKFILVSNFQVKMLSDLGVPSEVVEYPIEYKKRPDRDTSLIKLGLNPENKHVLHVGLFTPRKNQAEFFEYAKSLENTNIIFHSVGNMADNFKSYWEPLFKNKPKNVMIHGEKSNINDFYSAMDLFLFTSRGTINDKETMPLVIREAISWDIPTLIYNLPVYEDYFNNFNCVSYLEFNNFELNKEKILSTLNINETHKTVIVISTYPNTKGVEDLTEKSIKKIKEYGYDVILTSHYPITPKLQELSTYTVYDKNNILVYHDYYSTAWRSTHEFHANINIRSEDNHKYHGPAVYTNYYNGISFAKQMGYTNAICLNFDMVINDLSVINFFENELKTNKCVYNTYNSLEGETLRTVIFGTNIEYFLSKFKKISNGDDYNEWKKIIKSESNGLENMFYHTLKNNLMDIKLIENNEYDELLKNCEINLCSLVEYFTILPVKDTNNVFAVWLSTSNLVDKRNMSIIVENNGYFIDNISIDVEKPLSWYKTFIFNENDKYKIKLYQDDKFKKEIFLDNDYFTNKIKDNGLLTIK